MKIKGSDLKKIIKEEIQRSMLKEGYSFDASKLTVDVRDVAANFSRKFVSLVRPGARNALRDAITMDPDAEITFNGSVREFSTGGEMGRRFRSIGAGAIAAGSVADVGLIDEPSAFSPVFTYEEITVAGRPLPDSLVDMFNTGKPEGIISTPSRPVMFTGQFTLAELHVEDINLIGMSSEDARRLEAYLQYYISVRA